MDKLNDEVLKNIVNKFDCHLGRNILRNTKENESDIYQINTATGQSETSASVRLRSIRVAQALTKKGVGLDDLIILCALNNDDTYLPAIASTYIGSKVLFASVDMVYDEIAHILKMGSTKFIFCEASIASTFLKAVKDLNLKTEIVVFAENPEEHFISFSEFLKPTGTEESFQATEFDPSTTTAFIVCSSGTTGLSKGICLSHTNMFVQTYLPYYLTKIPKGQKFLIYSSMFWLTGIFGLIMPGLSGYIRLYSPCSFSPENLFQTINEYKPSVVLLTPMTTAVLLSHPNVDQCDFSSLKNLILLGSVVIPERIKAIQSKIPNGIVSNTYGLTEMCGAVSFIPRIKSNSCGQILPWVKWKVVDPDSDKILGPNQIGEFCCKSEYTQFLGYFNNPTATSEALDEEDWLHTGDLAYFDDEGFVYVVDRIKEMLKFQDHQVIPAELEGIIQEIEGVQACCVVGIKHPIDGDRSMAFVQLTPGASVSKELIMDRVSQKVGKKKQLQEGVVFLEQLPVTHSNKVNRKEINRIKMNYVKPYDT